MKKIGIYVSSLEQKGGGERFAFCLRDALINEGYEAFLICDSFHPVSTFDGKYNADDVIIFGTTTQNASFFGKVLKKLFKVRALRQTLKKNGIDSVVCLSEFDAIRLAVATFWTKINYSVYVFGQTFQFQSDLTKYATVFKKKLPLILDSRPGYRDIHETKFPSRNPFLWVLNELLALGKFVALKGAKNLFTMSHQVAWETEQLFGQRPIILPAAIWKKEIEIGSIINRKKPKSKDQNNEKVNILTVSRLVEKKRINLLISALALLDEKYHLSVVGDGPDRKSLEKLVVELDLGERVNFCGPIPDDESLLLLKNANLFVSLDRADYDITVFEALAKGVPVLVSEDYDIDFENGNTCGISVATATSEGIANKIKNIKMIIPDNNITISVLEKLTWEHVGNRVGFYAIN